MKTMIATAAAAMLTGEAVAQEPRPGSVAPPLMQALTPGLAGYTDDVLFGDVWRRPELPPRERSIVTVAALIATGKTAQLEGHAGRALDNGVKPSELAGIVTHLAFYSGWPSAVSSLEMLDRVFRARGIDPASWRSEGARLPLPTSDAARAALVRRDVAPTAPKLAELTDTVVFDDLWRRSDLAPRDRSLVTIAALTASGDADQLGFHIRRGIDNGLTAAQVGEALTHLAFYAGWPKAMAAVAVAAKTFAPVAADAAMRVTVVKAGADGAAAPASNFTGSVRTDTPFKATGDARLGGARVTFQPRARTNWHTHPLGQLLIVSAGRGVVQDDGGAARAVGPGDVVWTALGVRHWHGAMPDTTFSHFAVAEAQAGNSVTWAEPVSDAQYSAATRKPE